MTFPKFTMNLGRINNFFVFFVFFFFLLGGLTPKVLARENAFVTIVNPVRGDEFWGEKSFSPLEGVAILKRAAGKENFPMTWLLRSDAIESSSISAYFKTLPKSDEIGVFLEIMPNLARSTGISYPQGGTFWHDANKIFLSGYKPEERTKLIDQIFAEFRNNFGYFPKSVGAWHVDAYSALYMQQKYKVTSVLICADQFGTDGYQIWGGWWGVPYYPSKFNILTPAQTTKNKLDLVVFWWAARDPELGYGGSVNESTYSVQVNDYQSHNLGVDYLKGLLDLYLKNDSNQFGQITIGLENDNNWEKIGDGFSQQLQEIARRRNLGELKIVTMADFSDWYKGKFKNLSPTHQIGLWTMNPKFRVGLIEKDGKKYIRDLRIYDESWPEANLLTANVWGTLSLNNPYKIDTVRFPDNLQKLPDDISLGKLVKDSGGQKVPFKISPLLLLFFYLVVLVTTFFLLKNICLSLLVLVGSVTISLPMVKSGLIYPYGMGFWGPNGHDGIWHIALINQLARFSLGNPVFAGARLTNYHFGFDLLAAFLSRLTGIIPIRMYFQILPPILAILIGFLTYRFVEKWTKSKKKAFWATFFVYFGGSWGWLVSLIRTSKLGGESMFWSNQAISTLINPPYALSLIVLLWGLIKFLDYQQKPSLKNLIVCSVLFGLLIQIKVYAGIVALGSLLGLLIISLAFQRAETQKIFRLFVLSLLVALCVFLPFNLEASSLLVFSPLWFPRTTLSYGDRLGWFKLENARVAYLHSGKWLKWILAEGLALTIFIFGNIGTRAIGFFYGGFFWKKRSKISELEIWLFSALIISLVLPLIFIQKGNPWNTIQFFYYFQFLMAIFAGVVIGGFLEKQKSNVSKLIELIISIAVVILTLPTSLATLRNDYLPFRPPARVSIEELEALEFLRKEPLGVVLTYPHDFTWFSKFSEPRPLYAYETTAYVSALSSKPTYLEDEMNLEISGYNWQPRREEETRFFTTRDLNWANQFLKLNQIRYLYLVKGQKINLGWGDIGAKKIFENGEVVIYKLI